MSPNPEGGGGGGGGDIIFPISIRLTHTKMPAKFHKIPSLGLQDINETNVTDAQMHTWMDNVTTVHPAEKGSRGEKEEGRMRDNKTTRRRNEERRFWSWIFIGKCLVILIQNYMILKCAKRDAASGKMSTQVKQHVYG